MTRETAVRFLRGRGMSEERINEVAQVFEPREEVINREFSSFYMKTMVFELIDRYICGKED